ncbi:MAG: universal stress protein [Chloroflexota bacterium]
MKRQPYRHILVPLDGSELAEAALPDAFRLARLMGADVTLLQSIYLVDPRFGASPTYPIYLGHHLERERKVANRYLNDVIGRFDTEDIEVRTVVSLGSAADAILGYAYNNPVDVIMMSTHGRTGLDRWVYGSVTNKVLRNANKPVLLVRSFSNNEKRYENASQTASSYHF